MDYGVFLKKQIPNPSRKSAHYTKQSKFQGSDRQVRGKIITLLTQYSTLSQDEIERLVSDKMGRTGKIVEQLRSEKLIQKKGLMLHVAG